MSPSQQPFDPSVQGIGTSLDALHDGTRALYQPPPEVLVAALADAQQRRFAARAVLACRAELAGIAQCGHQLAGGNRPDPRNIQ